MRLDFFPSSQWDSLTQRLNQEFPGKELLLTCRLFRDGGHWPNEKALERLPLLAQIANAHSVSWIDLEWEERESLPQLSSNLEQTRILFSHHNFKDSYTFEEFQALADQANTYSVDGFKMALQFQKSDQELVLYQVIQKKLFRNLLAAFSMGDLGKRSRIFSPALGAPWTYGYFGTEPSAPGQWSITELHEKFSSPETMGRLTELLQREGQK